jgi:Flp pilus assembly protein TadB
MKFLDAEHPFFRPRWRRIAVVAVCALWAVVEWLTLSPLWAILATALAGYTFYALILTFDPDRIRPE